MTLLLVSLPGSSLSPTGFGLICLFQPGFYRSVKIPGSCGELKHQVQKSFVTPNKWIYKKDTNQKQLEYGLQDSMIIENQML